FEGDYRSFVTFLDKEHFPGIADALDGREAAFTLCIDGLDELSPRVFKHLRSIIDHWPGPVIATTRQHLRDDPALGACEKWSLGIATDAADKALREVWQRPDIADLLKDTATTKTHEGLAELVRTPLGLDLLLAEKDDELDAQKIIEGHIARRVRALYDEDRLLSPEWTWWRTIGETWVGRAILKMLVAGDATLKLEHLECSGMSEDSLQRAVDFLDCGAITEKVGDREWGLLHRTFGESLAGRALARSEHDEWCEVLRVAIACTAQRYDELLRWATAYLADGAKILRQLLDVTDRPVSALRIAALIAQGCEVRDDELLVELVCRLYKVSSQRAQTYHDQPLNFLVERSVCRLVMKRHQKLLKPHWCRILSAATGTDEADVEKQLNDLMRTTNSAKIVCDVLRPPISLAARLYVDPHWYDEHDLDELASYVDAFRGQELHLGSHQSPPQIDVPEPFWQDFVTTWIQSVLEAWLCLSNDEERLQWLYELPRLADELWKDNSRSRALSVILEIVLQAVLVAGSRLQRWQALLSFAFQVQPEGADDPQWPFADNVADMETLFIGAQGLYIWRWNSDLTCHFFPLISSTTSLMN
ncbi:MAG: hypothetical protein ACNA8W_24135, partial [Bradymonadaceae bacterium]